MPAWVKQVDPGVSPPIRDQAAVHVLFQDQQVDLQPGHVTRYNESVVRIQTPQGLSGGTVAFAWNPDTQSPSVHRLVIRRGDKVIDAMANQTFTVVRRESNLENAVLDGVLTATIQPEGLQVGDVVDLAMSITESDPALQNHVENIGGGWNMAPIDRAHLWVRWPAAVKMQVRSTTGLPALKVDRKGSMSSVEVSLDNLSPLPIPKGAPPRYALMRIAEMSDFTSWADLVRLMAPLYQKAEALPSDGALRKEIATIAASSADPKARAAAALALVQDRVRYVFLGMNDGGLVPADAETTWQRRFGDCKGKTVLLLALLHGLGIEAEPTLVSFGGGDGLDERLPMIGLFNHVLVRATAAGQTYWLDGTRTGDTALDQIRTPDFRWGLPLTPGAALVHMDAPVPTQPLTDTTIRIDASAGITLAAPTHVELVLRDDAAVLMNQQLSNLAPDVLDRGLRDFWRNKYDFVTVKSTSASFDPAKREEKLAMDGDAKMDWNNGWYEADGIGVGYKADFTRDPGPNRDAPFAVAYPYDARTSETILLPPGDFKLDHGEPVNDTVAGIAYRRTATLVGSRFTVEQDERGVEREFPATAADAAQVQLRALADRDVFLGKPQNYRPTDRELGAIMKTPPSTAQAFVERGNYLMDRYRYDEAVADFTSAIALDPKNGWALADRGIAYTWQNKPELASRDFDAAERIDPNIAPIFRGRGMLADRRGAIAEGIAAYSRSLEIDSGSAFALACRANDYRFMGDETHALADADAALRLEPKWSNLYLLRANAYRVEGRKAEAIEQASLLVAANPGDVFAQVAAARIFAKLGQWDEASRAFDAALKIRPEADTYINRSEARQTSDFAGRQIDLDAAAKLEPHSAELFAAQAVLQEDRKAYADAIVTWTASLGQSAEDPYALVRRGIDEQEVGKLDLATKDFTAAHAAAHDLPVLAILCREKGNAGVDLDRALAECETALAPASLRPDFLESLGLVELRLGHLHEAAAAYDKALGQMPGLAGSLFGRALVEARLGDADKARTDRQAALSSDPDVAGAFNGLSL